MYGRIMSNSPGDGDRQRKLYELAQEYAQYSRKSGQPLGGAAPLNSQTTPVSVASNHTKAPVNQKMPEKKPAYIDPRMEAIHERMGGEISGGMIRRGFYGQPAKKGIYDQILSMILKQQGG